MLLTERRRLRRRPPYDEIGRVRVFATGGHLGNLHRPEVQRDVLASFAAFFAELERGVN